MTSFFRNFFVFFILFSFSGSLSAQKNWREITTVDDLYENYPELVHAMFNQFNLNYAGLEQVKAAHEKGDFVKAGNFLLDYYKTNEKASHLRREQPLKTDKKNALADTILKDIFVVQNVRGQLPWGEDGHRDWYYTGPNKDKEWAWLSNRHEQLDSVFAAYFKTGNPEYLNYIDLFLRDFIIKSQPYPAKSGWGSIWRGLEVSFRSKVWTRIFYGLLNNDHLSSATQLLLLSSLPNHADYNRNYHLGGNWLTMELSAVAVVAANFPEYKKSDEWLEYSITKMTESINEQVYEDGVQNELASHYHHVALINFEEFKATCDLAGKKIPDSFTNILESMYSYLAKSMRPNGFGALNNDSDLNDNRDELLTAAKTFKRPGWEFIASNGKSGAISSDEVSFFFPWAGQLISRSNYKKDAHWSFFDLGPWGTGHQHYDKLHISVSAYGRDLLVDAGRFAYTGEVARKFRTYALSSAGHNTVLIDSKGQGEGPKQAKEALSQSVYKITKDFDFATGSFDKYPGTEGKIKHTRAVLYVRGDFWVVVDRIITDKPRHIETLWHWHPNCKVEQNGLITKTDNETGNLAIIPLSKQDFDISLVKGREKPSPQGWYSKMYNYFTPNVSSSYSAMISGNATFVWILQPSQNKVSLVKSKIISEDDKSVEVSVKSKINSYQIKIPYFSSEQISFVRKSQ